MNLKSILNPEPLYMVITTVWLVLIGLCGIIALLVVPINYASIEYSILISALKVIAAGIAIAIWLITWYRLLGIILIYKMSKNNHLESESIN